MAAGEQTWSVIRAEQDARLIEQGTAALEEDELVFEFMSFWPGGDNVRATVNGLRLTYRCHICGDIGGH